MARDKRTTPAAAAAQPERRRAAVADSATHEEQCHPKKIFVGGLAHKTTTQELREHFVRYGNVIDAVVLRWPDGRSRGFGYVTFADVAAATAALSETHEVGGHEVDVKRAVPGTNKLFVGGLPQNTPASELREHFEAFGVVSDAVIMIDPTTNRSRGFGFVCYLPGQEGAAAVAAALEQYDHHRLRGKWIEVKSAAPPHKLAAAEGLESSPQSSPGGPSRARPRHERGPAAAAAPLSLPPGLAPPQRESQQAPAHDSPAASVPPGLLWPYHLPAVPPPALCAPPPWGPPALPAATLLQWMCPTPAGLGAAPAPSVVPPPVAAKGPGAGFSHADMMKADPMKVPLPSGMAAWSRGAAAAAATGGAAEGGLPDASRELQRSLEQLLKLQALRLSGGEAAAAGGGGKEAFAGAEMSISNLEEPESLAKRET